MEDIDINNNYEEEITYREAIMQKAYNNIKITTPEDFYVMRAMLDAKENAQIYFERY